MPRLLRFRVLATLRRRPARAERLPGEYPPRSFTSCRLSPAPTRRRRRLRASATSRSGSAR